LEESSANISATRWIEQAALVAISVSAGSVSITLSPFFTASNKAAALPHCRSA
jgi:hypothetical protein